MKNIKNILLTMTMMAIATGINATPSKFTSTSNHNPVIAKVHGYIRNNTSYQLTLFPNNKLKTITIDAGKTTTRPVFMAAGAPIEIINSQGVKNTAVIPTTSPSSGQVFQINMNTKEYENHDIYHSYYTFNFANQ